MKQKTILASLSVRFYCRSLFLFFLLISVGLSAQTVTGTVLNEESKPVVVATMTVKGTNKATTTNSSGNISINAPGNDVLTSLSVNMFRGDGTL